MSGSRPGAIFQIGDLLSNTYRIEAALGRGGTSEVYRARNEISGNPVALKVLRSEFARNEDYLTLMRREEEIRNVQHDAVVRYYHNQRTAEGDVFLVMDYVDGPGLDAKLKNGGMRGSDLVIVARRLALGLQAAHAKNIVHRDLSPDNVILRHDDPAQAVIIDFGIAKDTNPGAQTIVGGEFAGKYAYAAPEQLEGRSDTRSDLYSLGALLLATYRGKRPDVGNSPMDVIESKKRPLDTDGVPEPLKTVIDRLTVSSPDDRVQSATELLSLIDTGHTGTAPATETPAADDEGTVIAPRPAAPPSPSADAGRQRRGRGGLWALLGLAAVAAAAAVAYVLGAFDPLLGPRYPLADPYTLIAERAEDAPPQAVGNLPGPEIEQALAERIMGLGGDMDITLASGPLPEEWGTAILAAVDSVLDLPEWRVVANESNLRIWGLADSREARRRAADALDATDAANILQTSLTIDLGPRLLSTEAVRRVLDAQGDCGALQLANPPAIGYPLDGRVIVTGRVATPESRATLRDALEAAAGDREIALEVEVFNPALCLIDEALPEAPQGGIDIDFAFGRSGEPNPSGRYLIGENPVIDLRIPADIVDGFLYVSALDVTGNVFHLLPNVFAEDNSVAALRAGRSGPVTVRVAHALDEAADADGRKLAFVVDDSALGKTKIVAIHAESEIFQGIRPTSESAEAYAQMLTERTGPVRTLDSRILTTARP
ncbi:serine/threonine protein kinase [Rhodobacteraceae bacterium CCMM004]|nr:serine/threonine protein kinase [Rhodobacteraceae bacterium CCMM004]